MGNRAVITDNRKKIGVYLHWNGGRDTVEPLLEYMKLRGFRGGDYGYARMCQVMGNFFGGTLSLGVSAIDNLDMDNGDNGTYIIDEEFNIVGRECFDGVEQKDYEFHNMIFAIDKAQPIKEQVFEECNECEIKTDGSKTCSNCEGKGYLRRK